MKILGIDPGSRHTGWGVVECLGSSSRALAWGRLSPTPGDPLARRLRAIADGLREIVAEHRPDQAAVESVYHGANTRSLIVLAETRGALLVTLASVDLRIAELAPAMVKSAVAGSGRADKLQVARMVRLQLGIGDERLAPDASDALAVALACGQSAAGGRFLGS